MPPQYTTQQLGLMMQARSTLSVMFLMHIALEAPFAVQGLFASANLPVLDATNSTLVFVKMYATLVTATCVAALLVFPLPEYLPGKRAYAICLLLYHTLCAGVLFQAPRFIPISFGALAESVKLSPENTWGLAHAMLGLGFAAWWQGTLIYANAARQASQRAQGK